MSGETDSLIKENVMNDFWTEKSRAYAEQQRAVQEAEFTANLTPVMPEKPGGSAAYIAAAKAKAEGNRSATASAYAGSTFNLADRRAQWHDRAVQRYFNTRRCTDPAGYLAEAMSGGQQPYTSGASRSAYSDVM